MLNCQINHISDVNCVAPVGVKYEVVPGVYNYIYVGCGKCELCKLKKKNDWTCRLICESLEYDYNSFATLTYNDQNVPFNIQYRDFQLFCKRLRKLYKFRYYVANEYGSMLRTARPHFHVIFFGVKCTEEFRYNVAKTWDKGFVTVSNLNNNRCKYACGYVEKKFNAKDNIHTIDPFCCMSRMPGIGHDYFLKNKQSFLDQIRDYNSKFGFYLQGKRYGLPHYFLSLFDDNEKKVFMDRLVYEVEQRRNRDLLLFDGDDHLLDLFMLSVRKQKEIDLIKRNEIFENSKKRGVL